MTLTSDLFDGHYYTEVVTQTGKSGWFQSDKALGTGLQTVRHDKNPEPLQDEPEGV